MFFSDLHITRKLLCCKCGFMFMIKWRVKIIQHIEIKFVLIMNMLQCAFVRVWCDCMRQIHGETRISFSR